MSEPTPGTGKPEKTAREVLRLAEKATSGEWLREETTAKYAYSTQDKGYQVWARQREGSEEGPMICYMDWPDHADKQDKANNAAYIAFANPSAMSEVCRAWLELAKQFERAFGKVDDVRMILNSQTKFPPNEKHDREMMGIAIERLEKCLGEMVEYLSEADDD